MILVTGANGLLGSHLVDALVARGDAVRAMVMPNEDPSRLKAQGVEICYGDMKDAASLAQATRGISIVLHCAAKTGPWGPLDEYEAINVRGLEALTRAAMAAGVRRLVHVSSITVHGNEVRELADESAPFRNEPNPYTQTKIAGERLLRRMIRDEGSSITIVRPGIVYGPRDTNSFGRFVSLIEQGQMPIIGSGNNQLPLIYVTDVAQGILLASESDQAIGKTYLLVNDEPVTQRGYFNAIAAELGVRSPRLRIPYHMALYLGAAAEMVGHLTHRKQPPPIMRFGVKQMASENRFVISRARGELGFVPEVNLVDGVRKGVAWYRMTRKAQRA